MTSGSSPSCRSRAPDPGRCRPAVLTIASPTGDHDERVVRLPRKPADAACTLSAKPPDTPGCVPGILFSVRTRRPSSSGIRRGPAASSARRSPIPRGRRQASRFRDRRALRLRRPPDARYRRRWRRVGVAERVIRDLEQQRDSRPPTTTPGRTGEPGGAQLPRRRPGAPAGPPGELADERVGVGREATAAPEGEPARRPGTVVTGRSAPRYRAPSRRQGRGNSGSFAEGMRLTSAAARKSRTSARGTAPSSVTRSRPSSATRPSRPARALPSPTTRIRTSTAGSRRANASTTRSRPFATPTAPT